MPEQAQRDVRRQRASLRKPAAERLPIRLFPEAGPPAERTGPRSSRRRANFGGHIENACLRLGYGSSDDEWVLASREAIAPHIPTIVAEIFHDLLLNAEMARQFEGPDGSISSDIVVARRQAFENWLYAAIDDPLDGITADYVASIAHAQVRPRGGGGERIKGRHVVAMVMRAQVLVLAILGELYFPNPQEFKQVAAAWSKRFSVHMDLLLTVYGATESSAHWY
jgi:Protoglobin